MGSGTTDKKSKSIAMLYFSDPVAPLDVSKEVDLFSDFFGFKDDEGVYIPNSTRAGSNIIGDPNSFSIPEPIRPTQSTSSNNEEMLFLGEISCGEALVAPSVKATSDDGIGWSDMISDVVGSSNGFGDFDADFANYSLPKTVEERTTMMKSSSRASIVSSGSHQDTKCSTPTTACSAELEPDSPRRAKALHSNKTNDPPLRALSAYNFFFQDERDRILNKSALDLSSEKEELLLKNHWNRDRSKKRRHRKTHGKIDFTTLSRLISGRWKALPDDSKSFYKRIAAKDWERYQNELAAQKQH